MQKGGKATARVAKEGSALARICLSFYFIGFQVGHFYCTVYITIHKYFSHVQCTVSGNVLSVYEIYIQRVSLKGFDCTDFTKCYFLLFLSLITIIITCGLVKLSHLINALAN